MPHIAHSLVAAGENCRLETMARARDETMARVTMAPLITSASLMLSIKARSIASLIIK